MSRQSCLWAAVLAAGLCAGAVAQQTSTAAKIVFKNPGPFAQADLEAVAGVHAGQKLSLKDFQSAAQRLVDTGCFEDVHVDSAGPSTALTVIFILKPVLTGELYPAEFENFVWFTPDELHAILHQSAPLFETGLPEASSALDPVNAALEAALASKGVSGAEVAHEFVLATTARPHSSVSFHVNRPAIDLRTVTLQGVNPEFAPALDRMAQKLRGTPYVSGDGPGTTEGLLLEAYRNAGYIDARLLDVKLAPVAGNAGAVGVDLLARVDAGSAFRVGTVSFEGTPVVSEQAFAAGSKLHTGAVASQAQLLASLAPVDAAYHKLGYMEAYVDPQPSEDTTTKTVNYAFKVVPGAIYRLHNITVQGLPPESKAQFDAGWTMKPGDPYNSDYVRSFLTSNSALRSLQGFAGNFQAAADPSTQTVDLTVTFAHVVHSGGQ